MSALLLLGKDLRVLVRSPLLLAAFVLYPLLIAALVGVAVRYADQRPRVAFVDLDGLPRKLVVAGHSFDVQSVLDEVANQVDLVRLSEGEADRELADGRVVAEVIVPSGFASTLRGLVRSPTLELRTGRGALADRAGLETEAAVYRLNKLLQERYIASNLGYVKLLLEGGKGSFVGNEFDVIGLGRAGRLLAELERTTTDRADLARIRQLRIFVREATLAVAQTRLALRTVASPIELVSQPAGGRSWIVSAEVQSIALALSLAFVCTLLAAGAIAAERDENVIGRLARGLVRLGELVAEKIGLATFAGLALGLLLAVVFGIVVEASGVAGGQPWQRLPLLALGLVLAAAAFGAFGVLVGTLAREARTATLVAVLVSIPLVLLGLLPSGTSTVASWISDFFPLRHAVSLFESALYDERPWGTLGRHAAWLVGLAAAFGAAARIGVRRLL